MRALIDKEHSKPGPEGVTHLLQQWSEGDREALDKVLPLVYDQLRAVARANFSGERRGNPLQTTELVNMVYMKLARGSQARFKGRDQFFWYASQMMRHILVDQARQRLSQKHGSGMVDSLEGDVDFSNVQHLDYPTLIALDNALKRLEDLNSQQCRIIELRYFAGMTIEETARIMSIAPATVKRDWSSAKRWLFLELSRK
ncbi:MAG: ECF-type sigma factor [Acidobacteriota bacterium]|nr:ECF-type sigma factor [Acidobacteriota bacterium]